MNNSILWLIIPIIIIGVVCYLLEIPERWQKILYVIAVVWVIGWVLKFFGVA